MFDFSIITSWIHQTLTSVMPEGLAVFIECVVIGVCIVALYAILAILLIYMERKVCGFFQCRLGPNRVGKWGSIQVLCDVLKMDYLFQGGTSAAFRLFFFAIACYG